MRAASERDATLDVEAFLHDVRPVLSRLAYTLTRDLEPAGDLVQETFVRLVAAWPRVRAADDPVAYACRTLTNLHHRGWSRERRRGELEAVRAPVPSTASPEHEVTERIVVREALARLTDRQRAVLLLRFYEDHSVEQTAAALGCSTGTVKSQTSHALRRLRELAPEVAPDISGRPRARTQEGSPR